MAWRARFHCRSRARFLLLVVCFSGACNARTETGSVSRGAAGTDASSDEPTGAQSDQDGGGGARPEERGSAGADEQDSGGLLQPTDGGGVAGNNDEAAGESGGGGFSAAGSGSNAGGTLDSAGASGAGPASFVIQQCGASKAAVITDSATYADALAALDEASLYLGGTSLRRIGKPGEPPAVLWEPPSYAEVAGISVDAQFVYFGTTQQSGSIARIAKLGGAAEMLASSLTDGSAPVATALDGDFLYSAYRSASNQQLIVRMPKTGGAVETIWRSSGAPLFVKSGLGHWLNGSSISRGTPDGSYAEVAPRALTLFRQKDDTFYYSAVREPLQVPPTFELFRISAARATPTLLARLVMMDAVDVHTDERFAYVFTKPFSLMAGNLGGRCLVAFPLAGGPAIELGDDSGYGLADDEKRLYWLREGALYSRPKPE